MTKNVCALMRGNELLYEVLVNLDTEQAFRKYPDGHQEPCDEQELELAEHTLHPRRYWSADSF